MMRYGYPRYTKAYPHIRMRRNGYRRYPSAYPRYLNEAEWVSTLSKSLSTLSKLSGMLIYVIQMPTHAILMKRNGYPRYPNAYPRHPNDAAWLSTYPNKTKGLSTLSKCLLRLSE